MMAFSKEHRSTRLTREVAGNPAYLRSRGSIVKQNAAGCPTQLDWRTGL